MDPGEGRAPTWIFDWFSWPKMNAKILMRLFSSKAFCTAFVKIFFENRMFFSENDQNTRMKSYEPIRFHIKFLENQSRSCNDRYDFRKVACPSGSRPSPGRTTGAFQSKIGQKFWCFNMKVVGFWGFLRYGKLFAYRLVHVLPIEWCLIVESRRINYVEMTLKWRWSGVKMTLKWC